MVLAQGLTEQSSTQKHTLGVRYIDPTNGKEYIYCQDSGAGITQYHACAITPTTYTATSLTKALADKAYLVGVAPITVTASYYFWLQTVGAATVLCKSACASEATLFTTATAGTLDDTDTSQTAIANIHLTASAATAANSANTACFMDRPKAFSAETLEFDVSESMANSAALLANSAAASAMSAMSSAMSASSSAAVADSKAVSGGLWDLAWSTFTSVVSAGSVQLSGASVAKASYPVEGNVISVIFSTTKSTG